MASIRFSFVVMLKITQAVLIDSGWVLREWQCGCRHTRTTNRFSRKPRKSKLRGVARDLFTP